MSTKRKLQQQRILGIFDELTKGWETAPDELTKAKETLQNIIEKDQDYVKLSEHARNSEEYPPANNLVDTLFVLYNKCLNDVNNNATLKHTPEQIIALFEDLVVPQRPVVLCCSVKDGTSQQFFGASRSVWSYGAATAEQRKQQESKWLIARRNSFSPKVNAVLATATPKEGKVPPGGCAEPASFSALCTHHDCELNKQVISTAFKFEKALPRSPCTGCHATYAVSYPTQNITLLKEILRRVSFVCLDINKEKLWLIIHTLISQFQQSTKTKPYEAARHCGSDLRTYWTREDIMATTQQLQKDEPSVLWEQTQAFLLSQIDEYETSLLSPGSSSSSTSSSLSNTPQTPISDTENTPPNNSIQTIQLILQ